MLARLATDAMGTRFELVLQGRSLSHAHAVGEECIHEIRRWHQRLNAFSSDSDVARLNRTPPGQPVRVDLEFFEFLEACERIRVASDGLFDIGCGSAMASEGFREGSPASRLRDEIQDNDDPPLLLDPDGPRATRTSGRLIDLGGVAKGFALDRVAAILAEHGINAALVHGGTSSVLARGNPLDEEAWGIEVRAGEYPSRTVRLRDRCLAVTAPRGRLDASGVKGHLIDPRSGRAVRIGESPANTAVVAGPSALACDAWAKPALLVGQRPANLEPDYDVWVNLAGVWVGPDG